MMMDSREPLVPCERRTSAQEDGPSVAPVEIESGRSWRSKFKSRRFLGCTELRRVEPACDGYRGQAPPESGPEVQQQQARQLRTRYTRAQGRASRRIIPCESWGRSTGQKGGRDTLDGTRKKGWSAPASTLTAVNPYAPSTGCALVRWCKNSEEMHVDLGGLTAGEGPG